MKYLIGFCIVSTIVCLIAGDGWAAMTCAVNAIILATR